MQVQYLLLACLIGRVSAHGRLLVPPGRSTMWRCEEYRKYKTLEHYDDHGLNCGGREKLIQNGGKCGLCGDPYDGEREHEFPGKYATGTIVANYTQGETIQIVLNITAPHGGWFEFRLCPNNNISRAITQECLDQHLLISMSNETRHTDVPFGGYTNNQFFYLTYRLPPSLICDQCVLQWKYQTAHNNNDQPQEEFYGCADVAIKRGATLAPKCTDIYDRLTYPITDRATPTTRTSMPKPTTTMSTSKSTTATSQPSTPSSSPTSVQATSTPKSTTTTSRTAKTSTPKSTTATSTTAKTSTPKSTTTTSTTAKTSTPKSTATTSTTAKTSTPKRTTATSPSRATTTTSTPTESVTTSPVKFVTTTSTHSTRTDSAADICQLAVTQIDRSVLYDCCQGRGILKEAYTERCRIMCLKEGSCVRAFCNDYCNLIYTSK